MQAMDTSIELDARLFDGHTTRTRRTHPQRLQRDHARTRSAWRLTRRGFNAARCRPPPAGLRQGERVLHLPSPPGLASPRCACSLPLCRATVASPAAHDPGRRAWRTRAEHHARAMPYPCQPTRTAPQATPQNVAAAPYGALLSAATPAAAPLLNRALMPIVRNLALTQPSRA